MRCSCEICKIIARLLPLNRVKSRDTTCYQLGDGRHLLFLYYAVEGQGLLIRQVVRFEGACNGENVSGRNVPHRVEAPLTEARRSKGICQSGRLWMRLITRDKMSGLGWDRLFRGRLGTSSSQRSRGSLCQLPADYRRCRNTVVPHRS